MNFEKKKRVFPYRYSIESGFICKSLCQ